MKTITYIDGQEFDLELLEDGQVRINGQLRQVDLRRVDGGQAFSLLVDGRSYEAFVSEDHGEMQVFIQGVRYTAEVIDEHEKLLREVGAAARLGEGIFELTAPMPGLVVKVPVKVGDQVQPGNVLVILESMKMQNELKAPQAGVVTAVLVAEGGSVEKRDVMVVLGPVGG
jgi:biotin carboxyl carrier protein